MGFFISLVAGFIIGIAILILSVALTGGFNPRTPFPHPDNMEQFINANVTKR